ncbi:MAG: GUN4-like family, partial [Chthonomonadales bacterium]|nr:GUN4-like family [Chthonomonadales bacterium]
MIAGSAFEQSSFYITGGTLPVDAPSYIVRQADRTLYAALAAGEYCYVLDTRQMGKSSLMIRTAAQLRDLGATIAVLDLTAIGQNLTPDRWYAGLLDRLAEQIGLEEPLLDYWRAHKEIGPMQRFVGALRLTLALLAERKGQEGTPLSLVLFLDEIDAVRSLPFSADEFFAGLRECYNRRTI